MSRAASNWGTESAFDAWATERFGASLVRRAQKRSVMSEGSDTWTVGGLAQLGDAYERYQVVRNRNRYQCSCQSHAYGEHRGVCSHILAVMLRRRPTTAQQSPRGSGRPTRPAPILSPPVIEVPITPPAPPGIPSPRDDRFGLPPLPTWVSQFRSHQWDAIQRVVDAFAAGKQCVIVDAPTGAGKTLLAETVRRLMHWQTLYCTTTKGLQTQIAEDFRYAAVLQGRANYPTADRPQTFHPTQYFGHVSAAECTRDKLPLPACPQCPEPELELEPTDAEDAQRWHCRWCHPLADCPYSQAKARALAADLAVVNLAYFLTETNGPGKFAGWPLVVLDEADTLETALMEFHGVTISQRWLERLGLEPPARKTVVDAWAPWIIDQALPAIQTAIAELPAQSGDLKTLRDRRHLVQLRDKLRQVGPAIGTGWVYTDYERGHVTFKPIRVADVAPDLLWAHGQRFLVMSATIISAGQFAQDLGLTPDQWASVTVANTFPAERRPVYVLASGDLSYRTKAEGIPKVAAAVDRLTRRYPMDRILIHTVSYDLTAALTQILPNQRTLPLTHAQERAALLDRFRRQTGAILLAPGLERGVDLPDDAARVVIIAKVPFPSLSDKQVAARLHSPGGDGWYKVQTVRSLVQMAGRGMRHADDSCHIYILDSQFVTRVWNDARTLLPGWFKEALHWADPGDGVLRLW